ILACGQLYVILTGGFDLSMGAVATLVVLAASILINGDPEATWAVIGALYAMGIVVGLVNGLVVAFLKVPSIIATLGTMLLVNGLALAWSGGAARGDLPDNFRNLGRLVWRDVPVIGTLPLAALVLVGCVVLAWFGLNGTVYGKRALAVGDNPRAAELAGAPVAATRILAFVVSAVSAVTAGILLGGFSGVSVNAGEGLELQAIAACVIGGAQLLGGRGSVWSAVFGALSLFALFTLLNLLGLPQALRDSIQGLILIAAVGASMWRTRRRT
ncbi:MAG TPA: ABC transporter permease, partial [Shinella sp.]|nr:ABC transporter permease [Shinella sp.]